MPSPVGHALAAITTGWAIAGPAPGGHARVIQACGLALLGTAADLDLLVNRHRGETHSIGAAVIIAAIAAWRLWPVAGGRERIFLVALAAWVTHPLLDALALDQKTPLGLMLYWPFSTQYVQSGYEVFLPVSRAIWSPTFPAHTVRVLVRELLLLVPPLVAVWLWRVRTRAAPQPR